MVIKNFMKQLNDTDFGSVLRKLTDPKKLGWSMEKAQQELEHFKVFFILAGTTNFSVVPTEDIDEVWHQCILHTKFYEELCAKLFGHFIHHHPSDGSDKDMAVGFQRTSDAFASLIAQENVSVLMNPYSICPSADSDQCQSGCTIQGQKAFDSARTRTSFECISQKTADTIGNAMRSSQDKSDAAEREAAQREKEAQWELWSEDAPAD